MVVKFHITRNNTHILASVLFPLETTSAARINPSVAWRHLFKLQPHHISCFSPGLSCLYSGTLPETLPSPPYPRRSHHLRKGVRKRNSVNKQSSPIQNWILRMSLQWSAQTISQQSPRTTYTPHIVWRGESAMKEYLNEWQGRERTHSIEGE